MCGCMPEQLAHRSALAAAGTTVCSRARYLWPAPEPGAVERNDAAAAELHEVVRLMAQFLACLPPAQPLCFVAEW